MSALTDAKMEELDEAELVTVPVFQMIVPVSHWYYFAQLVLASTNSKTNERDSKKDFYEWWDDEHLPAKGAQKITWGKPESMTRFSDPDYAKLLDEKSGRRKRKAIEMEQMVQSSHEDLGELDLYQFSICSILLSPPTKI